MARNLLASTDYRVRLQMALTLRADRLADLQGLETELTEAADGFTRGILRTRIRATSNHIAGWEDYINDGCPYEPRAQVTRSTYRRTA
ncbi:MULTISPECIES: hypothetical protein [Streptosporangium]|uniref:DUF664 domain-containing protein n=1 Tax=Streptosporangium brasiliense TaxID=47480 RepID=A0ABT9RM65_9ACTN|nr:hypothetical protein [Streptosporangium brasiliense]MDP9870392.1 hypothetical protein [Streptosporangium brasiliense]